MTYNVHVEMPSGARSRGYDRETEEKAAETFSQVLAQLLPWKHFVADVVLVDNQGAELDRAGVENA